MASGFNAVWIQSYRRNGPSAAVRYQSYQCAMDGVADGIVGDFVLFAVMASTLGV